MATSTAFGNKLTWAARILLILAFGAAGASKLMAVPQMVEVFEKVGMGQWLRVLTGSIEIVGALLLAIPATGLLGALLLGGTMVGAVATHLFLIGGSPVPAIVLGLLCAFVVFRLWRSQAPQFLSRLI